MAGNIKEKGGDCYPPLDHKYIIEPKIGVGRIRLVYTSRRGDFHTSGVSRSGPSSSPLAFAP